MNAAMNSDWEPEDGWHINDGPDRVYRPGKTSAFKLAPIVGGYKITFNEGEMDEVWRNCELFWRGQSLPSWGDRKLAKWADQREYLYDKGISSWLTKVDTDTRRLEGQIRVDGYTEAVMMFLAKDAVDDDGELKPLLVILMRTRFPWSQPRLELKQDGTAHAKPR